MESQTEIADSPDQHQIHTSGWPVMFLVVVAVVQGFVIAIVSSTWWPRDVLAYCLIALVTVLIAIAIIDMTITGNRQTQSAKNRIGLISLLMGGLGCIGWLLYYSLSKDPSIPLADLQVTGQLIGQLCMPLVCLAFGLGGWLFLSSKSRRMWGYLLLFLGLALLLSNEYAMLAYGLT